MHIHEVWLFNTKLQKLLGVMHNAITVCTCVVHGSSYYRCTYKHIVLFTTTKPKSIILIKYKNRLNSVNS